MLRRRAKHPVLAQVSTGRRESARPGALGRTELDACSRLASALGEARTVFVTGPAKSTLALGLAAATVADGRRSALLECDLAAPALAGLLGLDPAPGLREYLRGDVEASQILQPLVLAGPASGRATEPLTCISAGEPEASPVSLLDSEGCDHAIEKLRHAYDWLIIDGPPLDEDADALRALAELADATLVCGPESEIPRRMPMPVTGFVSVD